MANMEIKDMLLAMILVAGTIIILFMVVRIMLKMRKGPGTKKRREVKVLETVSSDTEYDDVFNAISSTRRIAMDLKRRGIDTSNAEATISKAESYQEQGLDKRAKFTIQDAKDMLMAAKKDWDKKTGFDVVPTSSIAEPKKPPKKLLDVSDDEKIVKGESHKPEEEFPELTKVAEKKPDNFLPSKFTISLATTAIDNARTSGANPQEAQRLLIDAKACFEREDYDEAFRLALCSKKEAEAILGVVHMEGEERARISDLATVPVGPEELKICSICGEKKVPYICIEIKDGEEATCKECYDKSMGKVMEVVTPPLMPPPPPPPEEIPGEEEKEETEEQSFCPNCGAKIKIEDVFCGKCGKPVQEELKCVGCGTKVEPGDMFCRKCGARLVT